MLDPRQRLNAATRVIRHGRSALAPLETDARTPESRMSQVWELTRLCLAMRLPAHGSEHEFRLQRSAVRIQRKQR